MDQQVFVSTSNIKLKILGARKPLPWWIGPIWITKRIKVVPYYVQLPIICKIHDVFHVSFLWPYTSNGMVQPPLPPTFEDNKSYKVDHMF